MNTSNHQSAGLLLLVCVGPFERSVHRIIDNKVSSDILQSPQDVGFVIESLIAITKQAPNKNPYLVILGLACDVAFHLKNAASKYRELLPQIRVRAIVIKKPVQLLTRIIEGHFPVIL